MTWLGRVAQFVMRSICSRTFKSSSYKKDRRGTSLKGERKKEDCKRQRERNRRKIDERDRESRNRANIEKRDRVEEI